MPHSLVYTCDFAVPRLGSVMTLFRSSPTRSYPLFHALLFSHMPARSSPGHLAKSVSPSTQFYLVNSYASLRAQLKAATSVLSSLVTLRHWGLLPALKILWFLSLLPSAAWDQPELRLGLCLPSHPLFLSALCPPSLARGRHRGGNKNI